MSQVITRVSGINHAYERISTVVPFSVALTADTYATPTGITVDLSTAIGLLGTGTAQPLTVNDIVDVWGRYSAGDSVYPTVVSSGGIPTGSVTVRLWNGESETADGAKTGTLKLYVLFGQGSRSYNT